MAVELLQPIGYNAHMTEDIDGGVYDQPFELQERMEWYQINSFLQKFALVSAEANLQPQDIIHIGGTANFYRCYQVFGPSAVMHFRGTHDIDLISFTPGKIQQVLDALVAADKHASREEGSARSPLVLGYTFRKSSSLPQQRTFFVDFVSRNDPGLSTGFEIDVHEAADGEARFGDRIMKAGKIVLDGPEMLVLQPHRGSVAVPSLRDYFIMKMDVVDYSKTGLRPKDKLDILVMLKICGEMNVNFNSLMEALDMTAVSHRSYKEKVLELEELFDSPKEMRVLIPSDYPFLPSRKEVKEALDIVRRYKLQI